MRVFPIGVEHALDVPVQRPNDADAGVHQWPATFCGHHQGLGRSLPFRELLLGLRQLHDVVGSVFEGEELAAAGQIDRIFEQPFPPCWRLMQRGQPGGSFWRIRFAGPVFRFGRNPVLRLCFGLEVPDMGVGTIPCLYRSNQRAFDHFGLELRHRL
jgi:hypothetical protein